MSADQRGSNPTPVIPYTWGADGNTPTPTSAASPLPVTATPSVFPAATTDTCGNGTLAAAGSQSWLANASRRSLTISNTGATNSLFINAAASASAANFELKPGQVAVYLASDDGAAQKARTIFSTGGTTYSYEEVIA